MKRRIRQAKFTRPRPLPRRTFVAVSRYDMREHTDVEATLEGAQVFLRGNGMEVSFPCTDLDFAWTEVIADEQPAPGPRPSPKNPRRTRKKATKGS